jgi:UDP-2,3-diacylglucosamine pyrophosphatase LpxH
MRRIIVISDLHIGGKPKPMLGHANLLVNFLDQLSHYEPPTGETVELVINGDFVDFLAIEPHSAWTPDEAECVAKLKQAFEEFCPVFDAISRCLSKVCRFTLLLGNHDIESALPRVRRELLSRLGTNPHQCLFYSDNQAYRFGDLLVEHGNRYDSWNAIDYAGLRKVLSQASRLEPLADLTVCPGSEMVERLISPLKEDYPFVELLKPETKIVPLLLTALEPSLKSDVKRLYRVFNLWSDQWLRTRSWIPKISFGGEELIAAPSLSAGLPGDVRSAFADELAASANEEQLVSVGGRLKSIWKKVRPDGIAAIVHSHGKIPDSQIDRIQLALAKALEKDRTFDDDGPDGPYLDAARKLCHASVEGVVPPKIAVMGHTHLVRQVNLGGGRWYLNTGTWVDLIKVPKECLERTSAGYAELDRWLQQIVLDSDSLRFADPAYADVCLDETGSLCQPGSRPLLRRFNEGPFAT